MDVPRHLWQADHSLDRLTIEVVFETSGVLEMRAHGRARTARKNLWTYAESFPQSSNDLSAGDAVHHLALAVIQDRPRTAHLLGLSLRGGSMWDEEELPFR